MQQVAIALIGNQVQERKSALTASAFFQSGLRSRIQHSSSASFAGESASGLVKKGSTEKTIQSIERKRGEETVAVLMRNGFVPFLVGTWLLAGSAAQRILNCMRTTSSLIKTILNFVSKLIMDSRFVSSAIGHCMLRKMKRRLIRWNPYQMMLRAIPSQARRETCLKV